MSGESKNSLEDLKRDFIKKWNSSLRNVDKERTKYNQMLKEDKEYENMSEIEKQLYLIDRWLPETKLWLGLVVDAQLRALKLRNTYTPESFPTFIFNSVTQDAYARLKPCLINIYDIYIEDIDADDETKIKNAAMFVFNLGTDIAILNGLFRWVKRGNSNTGDSARLNSLFSTGRPGNSNTGLRLRL